MDRRNALDSKCFAEVAVSEELDLGELNWLRLVLLRQLPKLWSHSFASPAKTCVKFDNNDIVAFR